MQKTDTKKEWESVAKSYSVPHIRKAYIRKPAILKSIGKINGKKIIDLGCGDGYYSRIFAKHGANVVGVDFSEQSILLAKKIEQENPLSIQYYQADISNMSFFRSKTFDIAVADMVLVTIPSQNKYIKIVKEIRRILKPNGIIIISKVILEVSLERKTQNITNLLMKKNRHILNHSHHRK